MITKFGLQPGQTAVRRYFRGPHLAWAQATRVLADDGRGLLLWLPEGADFACRVDFAGRILRDASVAGFGAADLSMRRWIGASALLLHPPGAAHSVWWFFTGGAFTHWYVNLESPAVRGPDGVDVVDHHLGLVVEPDRSWKWKDEDDFTRSTGEPGFWTAEEAREIRAEGERAAVVVEAGGFPFDGTWCEFTPEAGWPRPELPMNRSWLSAPAG